MPSSISSARPSLTPQRSRPRSPGSFPDQPDGGNRLGMVYEARGENQKAAESYRKVIEFIRQHPDAHPPGFEDPFVTLVDRLDPPQARS